MDYKDFCYWHMPCAVIDKVDPGTACTARLSENRVYKCSYESLEHAKTGPYPCVDAQLSKDE